MAENKKLEEIVDLLAEYGGFDREYLRDKLLTSNDRRSKLKEAENKTVRSMNEELKPCQCGSDVELCRGDDDYYIYCPKCRLKTFSDRVYDNITDNCDRLIDAWNGRANNGK